MDTIGFQWARLAAVCIAALFAAGCGGSSPSSIPSADPGAGTASVESADSGSSKPAGGGIATLAASGSGSAVDPSSVPGTGGGAAGAAATPPPPYTGKGPLWRTGMVAWQWKQIPSTDLGSVRPVTAVTGDPDSRINAWNGMASDALTGRLFIAGVGGHADYAGNEAYSIDLSVDAPRWRLLREPSASSDVRWNVEYYADGRPSSTHTYYALHFVARQNRVFRVGSGSNWGSGNFGDGNTNAFNLATMDWEPAGTFGTYHSTRPVLSSAICKHPVSEDLYAGEFRYFRRFDAGTGRWSNLAEMPDVGYPSFYPCAVDPVGNKVVIFGDNYVKPNGGIVYDIATNKMRKITFSGAAASTMTLQEESYAWYDSASRVFLVKTRTRDQVIRVDPTTYQATLQTTTGGGAMPDAVNGVHTRWQYLPTLGGFAYYPAAGSGIWFLATQ